MSKKEDALKLINRDYLSSIKPIFEKKCFDCHSTKTNYPWYYKLPIAKQLLEYDIKKAKEHLDFTNDFPFLSHDTPFNDLQAILKSTKEETMPPLRYRLLHSDSKLSKKEILSIEIWINNSLIILKNR